MKFKLDENLPGDLVHDFRAAGHDADSVYDEGLAGAEDSDLMARLALEGRVMVTMDKGIADIRVYPPENYAGIILLRPTSAGRLTVARFVRERLKAILECPMKGQLIIVSEAGIRIRSGG